MKTVVITGSAKGFGYAMLELFYKKGFNVVICDVIQSDIDIAVDKLSKLNLDNKILSYNVDVTKEFEIDNMIKDILTKVKTIDIWINNAGVNQPNKYIWELDSNDINKLLDIDLKGSIIGSKNIMNVMVKQGFGAIYNVEGYGSNDAHMTGLSIYGTAKRALTYFTESLAHEVSELNKDKNINICVGKITPGIMITNFINTSLGNKDKIILDDKTKKIYNILGDYPETIAEYMVDKIINNNKNNVKFAWLTGRRAMGRFIKAMFGKKNDFFK